MEASVSTRESGVFLVAKVLTVCDVVRRRTLMSTRSP